MATLENKNRSNSSIHEKIISIDGLCVNYKNGNSITQAVKSASFDICKDELMIILGASGSGKTSILNAVGGMLTPNEGSIIWNGIDVAKMSNKQKVQYRRNTVGFIFQRYNLIPNLTAEENVAVAAKMAKNPLPVGEVFDILGIKDKMKSFPGQLSGGEQQRVCIARALVKRPQMLLCDEPTGALDSKNSKIIMLILQEIAKLQHIPVVVITHNPQIAELADHYLFMSNGKIEENYYCTSPLLAENLSLS